MSFLLGLCIFNMHSSHFIFVFQPSLMYMENYIERWKSSQCAQKGESECPLYRILAERPIARSKLWTHLDLAMRFLAHLGFPWFRKDGASSREGETMVQINRRREKLGNFIFISKKNNRNSSLFRNVLEEKKVRWWKFLGALSQQCRKSVSNEPP